MSRAFTCSESFDQQMQIQQPDIASSLTHPHPSLTPCSEFDRALSSVIDDTTASLTLTPLTPCLTTASTKTFYSAIDVTMEKNDAKEQTSQAPTDSLSSPMAGMEGHAEKVSGDSDVTVKVKQSPTSKPKKSRSRASSTSRRGLRSASSSTTGRSSKAHRSSMQAGRGTTSMSQKKRDDLLALHRDCCRLFQDSGLMDRDADLHAERVRSYTAPARPGTRYGHSISSKAASDTMSPILRAQRSPFFAADQDGDISDDELLASNPLRRTSVAHSELEPQPYVPVPATVIDWTSPSTRRREYEKIDRSNRGIRRIWRRIAPKCLQSSARTPFFEAGKDGKGNYEGSVRRFRMDIPDEKEEREQLSFPGSDARGKWSCFARSRQSRQSNESNR
ncbi:hypothetical protein VTN77DRAFT_2553 [Rasamsonia byssochlamydoides]|uniref:uncharacterized protein n=1 Tax=Rasamsonia byssochlamydoides TaxID=89139 RepID=UPI0037445DAE